MGFIKGFQKFLEARQCQYEFPGQVRTASGRRNTVIVDLACYMRTRYGAAKLQRKTSEPLRADDPATPTIRELIHDLLRKGKNNRLARYPRDNSILVLTVERRADEFLADFPARRRVTQARRARPANDEYIYRASDLARVVIGMDTPINVSAVLNTPGASELRARFWDYVCGALAALDPKLYGTLLVAHGDGTWHSNNAVLEQQLAKTEYKMGPINDPAGPPYVYVEGDLSGPQALVWLDEFIYFPHVDRKYAVDAFEYDPRGNDVPSAAHVRYMALTPAQRKARGFDEPIHMIFIEHNTDSDTMAIFAHLCLRGRIGGIYLVRDFTTVAELTTFARDTGSRAFFVSWMLCSYLVGYDFHVTRHDSAPMVTHKGFLLTVSKTQVSFLLFFSLSPNIEIPLFFFFSLSPNIEIPLFFFFSLSSNIEIPLFLFFLFLPILKSLFFFFFSLSSNIEIPLFFRKSWPTTVCSPPPPWPSTAMNQKLAM